MFWGYLHNVSEMFFVDYINFYILLSSVAYYNQNATLNASVRCCTSQQRWTDQWHLLLDLQQGHINIFLPTPGLPKAATCWLLTVISKSANQQRPLAASRASPLSPLVTVVQITRQQAALGCSHQKMQMMRFKCLVKVSDSPLSAFLFCHCKKKKKHLL